MKLELDLSNRAALHRQKQTLTRERAEIDRALKIVEMALADAPDETPVNGEANADFFAHLEPRFRIGNLLAGFPDLTRREARELIQQWETEHRVRIVERTRGNRGNT